MEDHVSYERAPLHEIYIQPSFSICNHVIYLIISYILIYIYYCPLWIITYYLIYIGCLLK